MSFGSFLKKSFKKNGGFGFITQSEEGDDQINPLYKGLIGGAMQGLFAPQEQQMPVKFDMIETGQTPPIGMIPPSNARPMTRDTMRAIWQKKRGVQMGQPMRGLRYGGKVRKGESVVVGEDGEEIVTRTPHGEVIVTPAEAEARQLNIPAEVVAPVAQEEVVVPQQDTSVLTGTVSDQQISPAEEMYQRINTIQERLAKGKGGYDDKKKDWKDILRGLGLGALRGMQNADPRMGIAGMLGAAAGGAGVGGVRTGIDRTYDNQMQDEMQLGQLYQQYEPMQQMEVAKKKAEQEEALRKANIEIATQKPDLEKYKADTGRMRAENDLLYKTETIALGKRKADELKIYRDAIVELKEKGANQYDVRLKQLQEVIDESKRRNQETEKDKDLDREARITVAQIAAGSRERVANINQGGQNYRTEIKNDNDGKATLVAIDSAAKPEGETDEQFNARKNAAKESIYKQYPNLRPK